MTRSRVLRSLGRAAALALCGCALLALFASVASAAGLGAFRPGGGHTYSGGSSGGGSSGGGGGGGGDLVAALIWLCVDEPVIGIPLAIIVIVVVVVGRSRAQKGNQSWSQGGFVAGAAPVVYGGQAGHPAMPQGDGAHASGMAAGSVAVRAELEALRQADPDFSLVIFEDFLYALYAAAHEARGGSKLYDLRSYLGEQPTALLTQMACADVKGVVIGSMSYERARRRHDQGKQWIDVKVRFESNYTETDAQGKQQTYYAIEHWLVSRRRDAKSKPPARARVIGCPNCGGPQEKIQGNVCSYCGQTIVAGEFDWAVWRIDLESREPRPPQLTSDAPEVGTEDPTVVAAGAEHRYHALVGRDPSFSWDGLQHRVGVMFAALQQGWSSQRWDIVRPYVSDQLFQMQLYWIETYQRARLRNITENGRILNIVISDVRSDKHYDAFTLRVFATSLDYTLDEKDKLVSGSRKRERQYSEYWTIIRGHGAQKKVASDDGCPNCGAPLEVNMAGECGHCKARITTGQFDWVLSRIEQDESYRV
jgi:predicted lipid-binding transport protein (Tim44 family)/ribosomal protein L32